MILIDFTETDATITIVEDVGTVEVVGQSGPTGPPGIGTPPGGNAGALLTKNSADDYDTSWQDHDYATVEYVNTRTPQITVGETQPANPNVGDVWINTAPN